MCHTNGGCAHSRLHGFALGQTPRGVMGIHVDDAVGWLISGAF